MGTPRAIVIRAAGINCDQESRAACEKVGFQTDVIHVNRLIENRKLVHNYQFLIVREGWGYGGFNDRYRDLRVDDHVEPIKELKRILDLHRQIFPRPGK